ncbi:MAG: hypothetical protein IJ242_10565 [Clostridia bacterium]|nr:hypothetical protein [Clostridia bacterium]
MSKQTCFVFCIVLCLCFSVLALAEPEKQECLFVTADASGHVYTVTDSIKLLNPDGLSDLADISCLTAIQPTGEAGSFTQDGETLTWHADGRNVSYQGTSETVPPVVPVVTLSLDGKPIEAENLKDASGHLSMTVAYQKSSDAPFLAITAIPALGGGINGIEVDHGMVFDSDSRQVIVGYALPGLDLTKLDKDIDNSFTITADVDHPDIRWMMSIATAEPLSKVIDQFSGEMDDAQRLLRELDDSMDALHNSTEQPDASDRLTDVFLSIRTLVDGTVQLADGAAELSDGAAALYDGTSALKDGADTLADGTLEFADGMSKADTGAKSLADGAAQLAEGTAAASSGASALCDGSTSLADGASQIADGALQLKGGIAQLNTGLAQLTANNEALNAGAAEIFNAILETANQTIAGSGLSEAGIDMPALTADNYQEVLSSTLEMMTPEGIQAYAEAAAREQVRAQVDANADKIEAAVTEAAKAKVLEGVLAATGMEMDAASYEAAVNAGQVPQVKQMAVTAAVNAKLGESAVIKEIAIEIGHQKSALIEQYMESEDIQKQIQTAVTAAASNPALLSASESLTELLQKLDSIHTFVSGLSDYTAGVEAAAAGGIQLAAGADTLAAGTTQLSSGAAELRDGTAQLNDGITALNSGAGELSTGASALVSGLNDLTAASIQIRDGAASLADGTVQVNDGTKDLYDGSVALASGSAELRDGIQQGIDDLYDTVLPKLDGRLNDLVDLYNTTASQLKVPVTYDLLPDGYNHSLLLITRTDLQ